MATPKKPTVKITGKASSSDAPKRPAAPKTSISRGASIAQSPKITGGKANKPAPKVTAKATPKPTKTPLSKSEKDFIAGQKYKAKITKKTGVYPNTAN
jgi:hypothetical protein